MIVGNLEKPLRDAGLLVDAPVEHLDYLTPRTWHVLFAVHQRERTAAEALINSGIAVYWPNVVKHVSAGRAAKGRRRMVFCALIPGYLFIALRQGARVPWSALHETPGIVGYLRDPEGEPAAMRHEDIELLRRIEANENNPPPIKPVHSLKTGDKVRFADDLTSIWPAGKVTALAKDGRIVVEVPLLGRVVPIEVHPHQIERCS